jgi:hypothetical protein
VDQNTTLPNFPTHCQPNYLNLFGYDYRGDNAVFGAYFSCGQVSMYLWTNHTIKLLADSNTEAPNHSRFTSYGPFKLSATDVIFAAENAGSPRPQGLYRMRLDGTGLITLVNTDTLIPGTTRKFTRFDGFSFEDGLVVLTAKEHRAMTLVFTPT